MGTIGDRMELYSIKKSVGLSALLASLVLGAAMGSVPLLYLPLEQKSDNGDITGPIYKPCILLDMLESGFF